MNFALVQSMLRRPRVLRGGKAPLYWKREYSRLTEGLGSLPRIGNWVREIAETQPRLLTGPLLGTCLTAVTSTGVARSDNNDSASSESSLTSPHVAGNKNKETAFDPTVHSKRRQVLPPVVTKQQLEKQQRPAVASQFPRRAPESLLRRAAPDTLPVSKDMIPAISSLPHGGASSPSINSSQQITRPEWLRLVASRAASRLAPDWILSSASEYKYLATILDLPEQKSPAPVGSTTSRASDAVAGTSPATVEPNSPSALQDDWLLPIEGQQASPQLLDSLAKRPRTTRVTKQNVQPPRQTSSGIDAETPSLPSASDPISSRHQTITHGPEVSRPLDRLFDMKSPLPPEAIDRTRRFDSTINSEEREQRASPSFAPTVLTPALSPLLSPASAGVPIPPVAADTARRIAWRDEVEAHETDLSVLAAQMKRILDEEARRHGIDV